MKTTELTIKTYPELQDERKNPITCTGKYGTATCTLSLGDKPDYHDPSGYVYEPDVLFHFEVDDKTPWIINGKKYNGTVTIKFVTSWKGEEKFRWQTDADYWRISWDNRGTDKGRTAAFDEFKRMAIELRASLPVQMIAKRNTLLSDLSTTEARIGNFLDEIRRLQAAHAKTLEELEIEGIAPEVEMDEVEIEDESQSEGITGVEIVAGALAKSKDMFNEEFWKKMSDDERTEEALGILISQGFHWNCDQIARTFRSALEDSNWHSKAAEVEKWLEEFKS